MLKLLQEFITDPKLRSEKWLSTCFLPEDWDKTESKFASGEYFTHNLMSSVLFEEAASLIPDHAIIVEIAPHGLLQAIMKRSHSQCMNVSLTRRGEKDGVKMFLETIGKLYQNGLIPNLESLYPKVEFPVSSETPTLSNLVGWDHNIDWFEAKVGKSIENLTTTNKEFIFSIHDDEYSFLTDYIRNGTNILPEAAILVFAWKTLEDYKILQKKNVVVIFENVKFHNEVIVQSEAVFRLNVSIQKASNRFEVTYENSVVADGYISSVVKTNNKCGNITYSENEIHLNHDDIYNLLKTKGYCFGKKIKNLKSANVQRNKASIKWNGGWITFLDAMIQFNILSRDFDGISSVKHINKLTINIDEHKKFVLSTTEGEQYYNALTLKDVGNTLCAGVYFDEIVFKDIPKSENIQPMLHVRKFIANFPSNKVDVDTALLVNLQIINENMTGNVIKIKEIISNSNLIVSNKLKNSTEILSLPRVEIQIVKANEDNMTTQSNLNADIVIFHNLFENKKLLEFVTNNTNENTYILCIETNIIKDVTMEHVKTVTLMHTSNSSIILLKKTKIIDTQNTTVISTTLDDSIDSIMLQLNQKLKTEQTKKDIILTIEKKGISSVQGFLNTFKLYSNFYLYIVDEYSPKFSITNNYYKLQIKKGLKVNMLENGEWGSFCYIPVSSQHYSTAQNLELIACEPGNIESLTWVEAPVMSTKRTIQVCYSGLSMKDSKNFADKEINKYFGMDYSGIDSSGKRVMGLLPHGAMASTVEADCDLLWPVPTYWSLQEASTVPLPYVHAFYCLTIRSFLYRKMNIFITGAAGALGQAVISIAHSLGCTVFGTVSNAEKKRFLLELFPDLNEQNIGFSYDDTFHAMVVERTRNNRCDIVLNCASGKIRKTAMGCVGFMKYFLNIDQNDYKNNERFEMFYLKEAKSYKSVDMSNIFNEKFFEDKKALQLMLSEGIEKGIVRPITSVVYSPTDITRAFKLLSHRSNRGRVLIKMKDLQLTAQHIETVPRITLSSHKSYIIVSDGTELSIELIDKLVQRGAKRLIINLNPKLMNGYFHVKYSLWTQSGVKIEFSSNSLQIDSEKESLIKKANKLGQVDGIFIVYNDFVKSNTKSIIDDENNDTAFIVSSLDKVCRSQCNLRYFVVLTATSRIHYNEFALNELEKYCLMRDELGLPSLYICHRVDNEILQPQSLTMLFNAMESSLCNKYCSVLSSDLIHNNNKNSGKINTKFVDGLDAFFESVMDDEYTASEPVVHMMTGSHQHLQNDLYMNPDDNYLIMIPGLEGNYTVLNSISERIKIPALALQMSINKEHSIPNMAKSLLKYIKMRIHFKSPFYLMGYSFGVNIALEMAALLEQEGLVGIVYCIDSSPDAMPIHLKAYLGNLTEEQLQNVLILHMFKLIAGHESNELKEILSKTTIWNDKIDLFISKAKNHASYTHQYLTALIQAAYHKIILAMNYKPKFCLDSELVLIKGIPHPDAAKLNDDYNLSRFTNKAVKIYNINSDHALATKDCRVSNFINRSLLV